MQHIERMPWHMQVEARAQYAAALAEPTVSDLSPEQRELRQALGLVS